MKTLGRLLVLAPLVLLAACTTITTKRDFDKKAKFGEYKTFAWAPLPNTQAPAPAVDEAIRAAVEKGLTARGYTKAAPGKTPDFYAIYHVTAVEKTDVRHFTDWGFGTTYRAGYGYYTGWPGNPTTYAVLDQYKVGALVLDFVEVRRDQLVWRGVASSVIGDKAQDNAAKADEAVRELLAKFPPPPVPAG
ncbi:MAG: DUF4136 domain-containing protein [Chthoniobacter sp.]|nr:DUF4136 domain-containing protein [Chthoniobacter sp.]